MSQIVLPRFYARSVSWRRKMGFKNIGVNIESGLGHDQHGKCTVVASLNKMIVASYSRFTTGRDRRVEAAERKRIIPMAVACRVKYECIVMHTGSRAIQKIDQLIRVSF